ncbi:DNA-methyltransferase [Xanthobacter autotrophicus]|uniref:DNA-methyltransferase n=1 Tax=Xanthobacter autotrophicus TaxID=280 RepID=UPI0037287117
MSAETFLDGRVTLHCGDSRDVLRTLPDASIHSVVCDPPYALVSIGKRFGRPGAAPAQHGTDGLYARASAGFMGQGWDTGETAFAVEFWGEVLRVLKPGGHVVAFGGTRSYHRLACAIEDAGFEIRDCLMWIYATGFPKSHDVAKGIDRHLGAERQVVATRRKAQSFADGQVFGSQPDKGGMQDITAPATAAAAVVGWGTALKPAWEPIVLARKPLAGTVAETVLAHGTGALNIDGCRIGYEVRYASFSSLAPCSGNALGLAGTAEARRGTQGDARPYVGRWPANVLHDGSPEVEAAFPDSAARFFYSAKADADDRLGSKHPTVKPVDLMQWLCRLVTPPGGVVLDPFAGTGTTGEAAWREGFSAVLIEREVAYQADIRRRMALCLAGPAERKRESVKARGLTPANDIGPLFSSAEEGGVE